MELHLLHKLFGQWKDLVFGAENVIYSDAAGYLLKVQELHLQCQGAALEVVFLDASDELKYRMLQVDGDGGILADVRLKGLFTADTLPLPLRNHRPVIDAS